jgi:hypothetical protein
MSRIRHPKLRGVFTGNLWVCVGSVQQSTVQELQNHLGLLELEVKKIACLVGDRMVAMSSESMQNETKSGIFLGE